MWGGKETGEEEEEEGEEGVEERSREEEENGRMRQNRVQKKIRELEKRLFVIYILRIF